MVGFMIFMVIYLGTIRKEHIQQQIQVTVDIRRLCVVMIRKVVDKYMDQSFLWSETKNNQFDYINLEVKPTNIDHYFGLHSNTCFEI